MKETQEAADNDTNTLKTAPEFPDFADTKSIDVAFNVLYSFVKQQLDVMELDLFLTDDNTLVSNTKATDSTCNRIEHITPSVSLENTYRELEERGILDWAAATNEIKIIPNIDDNLKQIKSIIIIPVVLLGNTAAFFIANSPHPPIELSPLIANHITFIANHTFTLMSLLRISAEKHKISSNYNHLKQQTILASNQIATSEIFVALNESFESPLKIIKANLEFIQKDVGNTKQRIKILIEQFNSFTNTQKLMQKLINNIEYYATPHLINNIIEYVLEISYPFLIKNGININYKHDPDIKELNVVGFKIQLIFAIFNTIMYSISTMPEGGTINLTIDRNNENNQVAIIIIDNGIGINNIINDGNFIYAADLSPQKMQMQFLFTLSHHIITKHQGKFSTFCQENKGTTYKIILPCI